MRVGTGPQDNGVFLDAKKLIEVSWQLEIHWLIPKHDKLKERHCDGHIRVCILIAIQSGTDITTPLGC